MWPYNDDENGWLEQKSSRSSQSPHGKDFLPEYYLPESALTVESIDFYRRRAHQLRNEAIGAFFARLTGNAAEMFRQLGQLTSGNHAKIEAAIHELRHNVTPRNAGTAAR